MEAIVNGLRYSTEKATEVASDHFWDGSNWERNGRNTYLYKTKNGRFFIYKFTMWQGEQDFIKPISNDEAMALYEQLPVKSMEYSEAFGKDPDEA